MVLQLTMVDFRERFNAGVQHSVADSKAMPRKVPNSNAEAGKVSTSNQSRQDTSTYGNVSTSVGLKEENHPQVVQQISSDTRRQLSKNGQENNLEIHHREAVGNATSNIGNISKSYQLQEKDCLDDLVERISPHREVATPDPLSSRKEEALTTQHSGYSFTSNQLKVYHDYQQVNSTLQHSDPQQKLEQIEGASNDFSIDWEEGIPTSQQPVESDCDWDDQQSGLEFYQDWIIDVSRPRNEWEDLRQVRYQEMLDPFLDNNDIRELLQR